MPTVEVGLDQVGRSYVHGLSRIGDRKTLSTGRHVWECGEQQRYAEQAAGCLLS